MSHLENKMHQDGKTRFQLKSLKAQRNHYETILPGQNALVKKNITKVAHKIQEFVERSCGGEAEKHATVGLALNDMEADVIAVIVCKFLINRLHEQNALTTSSIELSQALDMERNLQTLADEHRSYYDFMTRHLQKSILNPHLIQSIVIKQSRKRGLDLSMERETSEHLHIGKKLIELFAEATGFISIEKRVHEKGDHPQYTVLATAEALDFIKKIHQHMELMAPVFGPITQKPEPRTSIEEGGFETLPTLLVKNRSPKALKATYKDHAMPDVYKAINAIQSTPHTINRGVYEVASTLWERKLAIAGLPERYDKRKHEQSKSFKLRDREELRGKNLACMLTLGTAKEYLDHDTFYFVHTLDFRGRAYPVSSHLSPQGNDLNKGLLTFAASQGKPLGKEGTKWLAIHGANCYGIDKVPFLERVAYVEEFQARILQTAHDPFADYWWTEADKPFQFLAFCFEWAGYCAQGESYVCALPVAVDGSSNALQHFAAILRDKALGLRVNMVPLERPNDIYQEICDKLMVKVQEEKRIKGLTSYGKLWAEKLNRSVVKQPVMTYYYGSKFWGTWEQIEKQVREQKIIFPKIKRGFTDTCITWLAQAIRELTSLEQQAQEQKIISLKTKKGHTDTGIAWFAKAIQELTSLKNQVREQKIISLKTKKAPKNKQDPMSACITWLVKAIRELTPQNESKEDLNACIAWFALAIHGLIPQSKNKKDPMNECIAWLDKASRELISQSESKKDPTDECITWLAKAIRKLILQEIPTLKVVMKFLHEVAKECCKAGKPIIWTTPSGFKVVLDRVDMKPHQIRTQLFGTLIQLTYQKTVIPPTYSIREQASGIAANFVHSLDASAMVLCVNEALSQGISCFRMIHDGFATVPGDMETLSHCIRISFIKMYIGQNILKSFAEETLGKDHPLVSSAPPRGALDFDFILVSDYFFA